MKTKIEIITSNVELEKHFENKSGENKVIEKEFEKWDSTFKKVEKPEIVMAKCGIQVR